MRSRTYAMLEVALFLMILAVGLTIATVQGYRLGYAHGSTDARATHEPAPPKATKPRTP